MVNNADIEVLVKRLKDDAADEGRNAYSWGLRDYLKQLLEDENLYNDAAIGSVKRAIAEGIDVLSDAQLRAIALDMLNHDTYMDECPNDWCFETIAWSDMASAIDEDQCCNCVHGEEKIKND